MTAISRSKTIYFPRLTFWLRALVAMSGALSSVGYASDIQFTKPVDALSAYRERPLFAPSRRPTPKEVLAEIAPTTDVQPLNAELLGIVSVNDGSGLVVLRIEGQPDPKRLHVGESIDGWTLNRLDPHTAVFMSGEQTMSLSFPNTTAGENGAQTEGAAPDVPVSEPGAEGDTSSPDASGEGDMPAPNSPPVIPQQLITP